MPVIMRQAKDDLAALAVMSAFDKHGIRIVGVILDSEATFDCYIVCGQAETIDCDEVDRTIERIQDGEEEI